MSTPLSSIYGKFADLRNTLYDRGVFKSYDLGARTISVGNITTGGTGKTPLVILVSRILAARGKRVCILTRGYGRANPGKRVLVSNGKEVLVDARTGGDEPLEMARKLLGRAIVVADADRVGAATWAKEEFGVTTFVLDDGFQHRRVKRDLDIICIDATDPFGGGKMLPSGRLREPLVNLKRAGIIVITRANLAENLNEVRTSIAEYVPDRPIFAASTQMGPMMLLEKFLAYDVNADRPAENFDYSKLANTKAFAFCGIGNPDSFFGQMKKDNFDIAGTRKFNDHHRYTEKEMEHLCSAATSSGAGYLLTTGKDAVKLAGLKCELPCFVLEAMTVIDDEERFATLL
jgi:tetraacyldisaccharide 4'-kinase